ncbi:hypothetical protein FOC4_g10004141 [Fusarium odoratissimum]|uniref:Uncharacterized protein n=1 Tax=Fusarium oxysporum f. sp. cubense (strain race 4) TaxID=2502994 RepID=N1SAY6_FUSC4|nr:hypothetical protein FOC4_g10004141 [Fusarium odoratissimum]
MVIRHWLSTLIRCLVIPILVLSLVLGVQNFTPSSKYGIGKPASAPILSEATPDGAKLFIIQPSGAGSDVSAVIEDVVKPLGKAKVENTQGRAGIDILLMLTLALCSSLLLPTSSAGITILWQILTGWALTSGCVFGATFAIRYSTILAVLTLIGMAAFAQLLNSQTEPITKSVAVAFSVMFPRCSYVFVLNSIARYEKAGKATNIYAIPPSPGFEVQKATIGALWLCFCFSIVAFPLVTIAIKRFVHGASRGGRQFKTGPKADNT